VPATLDLTNQANALWALLPEIVLAVGAMVVLLVDVWRRGSGPQPSSPAIGWMSVGVLAAAAVANYALIGVTDSSGRGMVALDGFRVFTNFLFLLSAGLTLLLSMGYLDARGMNRGEYHVLVLLAALGMMLMAGSRELILIFIALEVMSVAIYVLVGFDRVDPRASEASLKYFLLGAFASAFFLYGIALLFGSTGSTHLQVIANVVGSGIRQGDLMLLAGVALTLVGFGFKVAAIPFHMWTPDAYDGAPTPVTALMSTAVKAAAFGAFARVFVVALYGAHDAWVVPTWWLAALTMVVANLIAVTQGSVKRMLAYSSIAHAGYLLVALLSANRDGLEAMLFYLLAYTVTTVGAFGIVIANAKDGEERVTLDDYAGFGHQHPLLGLVFSVFLLSLAGFPLTAGFLGKLYILRAALDAGQGSLAVILVLASAVSYFYYLRVIVVMYMRPAARPDQHAGIGLPWPGRVAVAAMAVAVVAMFFLAKWPGEWARAGAEPLVQGAPAMLFASH
jgi:NADH-quinone oxidoreductase subunit N